VLLYHGWSDILITANNTVEYYERVVDTVGRQCKGKRHGDRHDHKLFDTQKFARLFMVPGMGHCGGGTGVSDFDGLAALEKWVERNDAPDEIIASNPNTPMTRPLCPYPQTAHYKGSGDVNDAANFFCSEDDF
jgi:feruloyl esterase